MFFKQKKAEQSREQEEKEANLQAALRSSVGSRCEVRGADNTLVFLGHIIKYEGLAITIYPIGGGEVPPVIYNTEFKVVIHTPGRPALVWMGQICGSSQYFWMLDHLELLHYSELRACFRQPVSLPAKVLCVNSLYPGLPRRLPARAIPCQVLDISLGGLQFRCRTGFSKGDQVFLSDLFLKGPYQPPFAFTCQIRWISSWERGESLYGARFGHVTSQEEDRLCAAILNLQRADLTAHRR